MCLIKGEGGHLKDEEDVHLKNGEGLYVCTYSELPNKEFQVIAE